jgi:D-alanyl-D-alanine carboxypeptidase (penicillin-binding protein 5/6)
VYGGTIEEGESTPTGSMPFELDCKSAVLMEASSGEVICAFNETEALPPASVTKIMTLLLVMEEIDGGRMALTDTVTASAYATSMGGSQIYLKEGEQMSVEDMLKSVVIASANDAAVALAEHISGSEEAFVKRMNERAAELGMKNTRFENTNGLDDTTENHVTSALDIAIMSRELIKHRKVLEYSSTWMDTIRNGEFGLTNTNRLVRFYKGATGLKTGSTSKAGFCVSVTAERGGTGFIAVIMGAPSRDVRNECAKMLLDYGFSNYESYTSPKADLPELYVKGGVSDFCTLDVGSFSAVLKKGDGARVTYETVLPEELVAPVAQGDKIGEAIFKLDGQIIGKCDIVAAKTVDKVSFSEILWRVMKRFLFCTENG